MTTIAPISAEAHRLKNIAKNVRESSIWRWIVAHPDTVLGVDYLGDSVVALDESTDRIHYCAVAGDAIAPPYCLIREPEDQDTERLAITFYETRSLVLVEVCLPVPTSINDDEGDARLDFLNKSGLLKKAVLDAGSTPGNFIAQGVMSSATVRIDRRRNNGVDGIFVSFVFSGST